MYRILITIIKETIMQKSNIKEKQMTPKEIEDTVNMILRLKNAKKALEHLYNAWRECEIAFSFAHFPEEVLDSDKYPFEKSFTDYNISDWTDESINNINKLVKDLKKSINAIYGTKEYKHEQIYKQLFNDNL